jgi:hypothetical protein
VQGKWGKGQVEKMGFSPLVKWHASGSPREMEEKVLRLWFVSAAFLPQL